MLTRCSVQLVHDLFHLQRNRSLFKVGIPHRSFDITVPEDLFDLVEVQSSMESIQSIKGFSRKYSTVYNEEKLRTSIQAATCSGSSGETWNTSTLDKRVDGQDLYFSDDCKALHSED